MVQRKPYNPNTAYGRKKLREQAQQNYEQMTPAEKREFSFKGFFILIVVLIIVFLIFYSMGDTKGFVKWSTR